MTAEGYPEWLGEEDIKPEEWNRLSPQEQVAQTVIHRRLKRDPDFIPVLDPIQALRDRESGREKTFALSVPAQPRLVSPKQQGWTPGIELSQPKGDRD